MRDYTKEQLETMLEEVRSGKLEKTETYNHLHELGEAGYLDARATVEGFLTNSEQEFRYIALNVLILHWGLEEHRGTTEDFLFGDPESENRRLAATCLGSLLRGTRDKKALRMLTAVFSNEAEYLDVRESAYVSIWRIWGRQGRPISIIEWHTNDLNRMSEWVESRIDWDWMREVESSLYRDPHEIEFPDEDG